MMRPKRRLTREAAYQALHGSAQRHAREIVADQPGSKEKLFAPKLRPAYKAACGRKRDFIRATEEVERCLARLAEALRVIMNDKEFLSLLMSEGLATIPNCLVQRLHNDPKLETATSKHAGMSPAGAGQQPVSGICPDVLAFLQDCFVKVKIFGLLRHVLPARQMEIARLMVAMERVTFTYAKILVAFTPRPLLAEGFDPTTIANVSEGQLSAMTPELGGLSSEFLGAVERRGSVSLELVAASRYFERLMDNSKVVRYLAHNFPDQFEAFHSLSTPSPIR
ncbi:MULTISPECIES: plasmid partitioning protein RepB C-terminal domain-containing protein [unclassified Mesorhizobium]|uniref:plasmid partitioning protein RepB C-terminal domain-containing protein n=2 Tax=Mesorhizobium TaxID=68287 RepID=UPI001FE1E7E5|nr:MULTISPECIES: plasmid partitioning protein RepB C-terminal domain-containing protein [unclassified Mesorhizobium]